MAHASRSLHTDGLSRSEAALRALEDGKFPKHHRRQLRGIPWTDEQKAKMRDAYDTILRAGIVAIIGGRGRGKTLMSTSVAYKMNWEKGFSCRYWTFADLLGDYRGKVYDKSNPMTEAGWFSKSISSRCLVIDELSERHDSEDAALFLTRILDYRYRNVLGAIVIANTTEKYLLEDLGPSAASRLREGGRVIECAWGSFRK